VNYCHSEKPKENVMVIPIRIPKAMTMLISKEKTNLMLYRWQKEKNKHGL
jgi:hypothetical protein